MLLRAMRPPCEICLNENARAPYWQGHIDHKQNCAAGLDVRSPREKQTVIRGNKAKPFADSEGVAAAAGEQPPEAVDQGSAAAVHDSGKKGMPDEGIEAATDALAKAEQELAEHRDALLRMRAEMDNLRKRQARDAERSRKFALERIMKDLLQVRDSLERGLEAAGDPVSVESLREGQALTLKVLAKVLEEHGLEVIDPAGQPFDPEWHEAMTVIPSAEADENTVLEVLQKGYRLHDRLIRPAMVVVSRKP